MTLFEDIPLEIINFPGVLAQNHQLVFELDHYAWEIFYDHSKRNYKQLEKLFLITDCPTSSTVRYNHSNNKIMQSYTKPRHSNVLKRLKKNTSNRYKFRKNIHDPSLAVYNEKLEFLEKESWHRSSGLINLF